MFISRSSYATFADNLPTVRSENSLYYLYDSDSAVLTLVYMLEMHAALSLSGFFRVQFGWLCYPAASLLTSGMYRLVPLVDLSILGFVYVVLCFSLVVDFTCCSASPLYATCHFSLFVPLFKLMLTTHSNQE